MFQNYDRLNSKSPIAPQICQFLAGTCLFALVWSKSKKEIHLDIKMTYSWIQEHVSILLTEESTVGIVGSDSDEMNDTQVMNTNRIDATVVHGNGARINYSLAKTIR